METAYRINEHGVVLNPTIVFEYCSPKFLAWDRYLIKVGKCKNHLWDFGYWTAGNVAPVSQGKYKSFEDVELAAIKYLNDIFSNSYSETKLGDSICFNNAKKAYHLFLDQKINKNYALAQKLNLNRPFQLSIF